MDGTDPGGCPTAQPDHDTTGGRKAGKGEGSCAARGIQHAEDDPLTPVRG